MAEHDYLTVSDIVSEATGHDIEVTPRVISDLFYQRRLDANRCPIIGGRRLVPRDYVDATLEVLINHILRKEHHTPK